MKKILFIILILTSAIFLAGCANKGQNQNNSLNNELSQPSDNINEPQISDEEVQKKKNEFLGWLNKKEGVMCTVTTSQTTIDVKLKNGKIKIEEKDKSDNSSIISTLNDGNWVYLWSDNEGVKYQSSKENKGEEDWDWNDDLNNLAEDASVNQFECKDSDVEDSVFQVPSGVNFSSEDNLQNGSQN